MGGCSTKAAMPDEPAEPAAPVPEAIVALGVGARVASATNDQRQALEIWETREAGRVLVVDGAVRLSEADERPYHEMLSHVAVCAAARASGGAASSVDSGDAASWFAEAARARRRFDVVILDADAGNPLDAKEIDVAVKAVLSAAAPRRGAAATSWTRGGAGGLRRFEDVRVFSWLMPTLKGGHCKAVLLGREPFDARDESNWDCELAGVAYFDGAWRRRRRRRRGARRARGGAAAAIEGWRPDAGARFGGGDVRGTPGLVADAAAGFEDRHRESRATPEKAPKRRPSNDPKIRDAQAALLEDENFLLRSPEAAVPARPADGADSIFGCTALGADALCKTDDFYATVAVQAEHFDDDGGEAEDDFVAMMRKLSGNHETKVARRSPQQSTAHAPSPPLAMMLVACLVVGLVSSFQRAAPPPRASTRARMGFFDDIASSVKSGLAEATKEASVQHVLVG
ncbi:spermidine synthase [Aureococcus anophagefferens]|nr:spermidine synthase [Aureococcus anophagefferens]